MDNSTNTLTNRFGSRVGDKLCRSKTHEPNKDYSVDADSNESDKSSMDMLIIHSIGISPLGC
jgi:hypothetical protein